MQLAKSTFFLTLDNSLLFQYSIVKLYFSTQYIENLAKQ
ncbi:hypothetical protein SMSK597_1386 [Streptococcus mitis SK597]|uniref:Uncharacterized protein n=1 Tax=Streptococcus mitis SK597 TaxID=585204 RepID=E1LTU2_STRMT|nr:hypothetical protein SMSK597_1386 [Streptococcus mitis SK597]